MKTAIQYPSIPQPITMKNNDTVPTKDPYGEQGKRDRIQFLEEKTNGTFPFVSGVYEHIEADQVKGNIENLIGFAQIPIGIAGPLIVRGQFAEGTFYVPLATTEGALVASYSRGSKAASLAGGIQSICIDEGVQRSPIFKFKNISDLLQFKKWLHQQESIFHAITQQRSNYAKFKQMTTFVEGNNLNVVLEFETGDAAGQNMVTFCSYDICQYILENAPVQPAKWYIESNFSGDKKANYKSFQHVRGKKVVSEIELSKDIVQRVLKADAAKIEDYWKTSTVSQVQLGSIGAQGHIANGLTALFIACGQDVACISEASIGVSRLEASPEGHLYASLTLPNLIVGTVGGGTGLPTQKECLEMLDCYGAGKSQKFAEIASAIALAGELSIAAAISCDHFVSAHEKLGRK